MSANQTYYLEHHMSIGRFRDEDPIPDRFFVTFDRRVNGVLYVEVAAVPFQTVEEAKAARNCLEGGADGR